MNNEKSNFFVAEEYGEVKEFVDEVLDDIELEEVITFGGIINHWGKEITPAYFRTLVSMFGKVEKKFFSVKVLPSGEGLAKVKRVR